MFTTSVIPILILSTVSIFATENVEGSLPVLQKTVQTLFTDRTGTVYPGTCQVFISSKRQSKMCKKEPALSNILITAKQQAITACEESFQYDRWNCSLIFNRKAKKWIFKRIYRETAFIYALIAASITHSVARGCSSGELSKCSCPVSYQNSSTKTRGACGDDFKYGKRFTKKFLELKEAGSDQIAEILRQDITVGIDSVGEQLREVCKCHGFSGSCTTKTCWKRLAPFGSAMGLLKKHYHHATKKKLVNYTSKRAILPHLRKKMEMERQHLLYLQKTPNLCVSTTGRSCTDRHNCATLCCGRGFVVTKKSITARCNCKMINCCVVKCETCMEEVEFFTCK